ncbi:hypothetical protein Tco_0180426 [Tanacetum coccineum]
MYTFSPMMVANSQKHHCRVRPYTQEVLVISTNLDIQKNHYPLDFRNRRGDEARIKNTWYNQVSLVDVVLDGAFGGLGEEEVVVGEGVVVTSSSLEMLINSCLGGIMVNLIFLEGFEEEALVEFMVEFG